MVKKIALFGIYPPPYGGRSVHIKRLAKNLSDENKIVHIYSNSGKGNKNKKVELRKTKSIIFHVFREKYDILHFHDRNFKLIFILVFLSKILKYKTILTYHSFRDIPENYGVIKRKLFNYCIKRIDQFICVGTNEKDKLRNYVPDNKINVIQSYISPFENKGEFEEFPNKLVTFINNSEFLISANGNVRFYDEEDLYGFDLLIELMNGLINKKMYNVKLLIAVLGVSEQTKSEKEYYTSLKERIKDYNIESNIFLFEVKNTELYPILKRSHLFIRPTNTDSYGISIAEAIYAGIPAIASDVCKRPLGTTMFVSRDLLGLSMETEKILNNYTDYSQQVREIKQTDYYQAIINLYERQ